MSLLEEVTNENTSLQDFFNILILHQNTGYLLCRRFKRCIIEANKLKFDINMKLWEDQLFIFQYMRFVKTFSTVNKALYEYNMPFFNKKYSSCEDSINRANGTYKVLLSYRALSINNKSFERMIQQIFIGNVFDIIFNRLSTKKNKSFFLNLAKKELFYIPLSEIKTKKVLIMKLLVFIGIK